MCPKFLCMHRFEPGKLRDEHKVIYVNPRRMDSFAPEPRPTQQPTLYCGTRISLGSKSYVIVHETVDEIVKLLSKK